MAVSFDSLPSVTQDEHSAERAGAADDSARVEITQNEKQRPLESVLIEIENHSHLQMSVKKTSRSKLNQSPSVN